MSLQKNLEAMEQIVEQTIAIGERLAAQLAGMIESVSGLVASVHRTSDDPNVRAFLLAPVDRYIGALEQICDHYSTACAKLHTALGSAVVS